MSKSYVNSRIFGPIKRAIIDNDGTRKVAQGQRGQVLSITEAEIKAAHASVGLTGTKSDAIWKDLIKEINNEEALMNNKKDKERLEIVQAFISKNNIPNAKIVTTHSKLSAIKGRWIKAVEAATDLTLGPQWYELGHGSIGNAISELTVLRGLIGSSMHDPAMTKEALVADHQTIRDKHAELVSDIYDTINSFNTKKQIFRKRTKLELETDMRVSATDKKGLNFNLSKYYVVSLTFQDKDSNAAEGIIEKAQITAVKKLLAEKYANADLFFKDSGSASLEEATEGVVLNSFSPKSGKLTGPKGKDKYTSSHKITETLVNEHVVEAITLNKPKRSTRPSVSVTKPSKVNIVALLNTKLPQEIRSRMTYPRLVNRTGRFSESVQVLSADTTTKGGTSFAYTYQKDPYQLFERGKSRLATPDREPRDIIDASIRSIAQEMMLGRFYTRRV